MESRSTIMHSTDGATLADILERVLDKGIVIAGDIKIKLVDIELLTIQVRLLIASVDKAREMGIDWWLRDPALCSNADIRQHQGRAQAANRGARGKSDSLNSSGDFLITAAPRRRRKRKPGNRPAISRQ